MIAAWTGAQVRAAETPFLERGEGPALMRRAAHGLGRPPHASPKPPTLHPDRPTLDLP